MSELLTLFQYDFMVRALIAGIVIGITAPMIGMYLVTRGYSLMADTLSHVALAGVAVGVLFDQQPLIFAVAATVIAAFGIERLSARRMIFGESVLAIFLSGSLAIAIMLMSLKQGLNANLLGYLFGSITTVSQTDVYTIVALGACIIVSVIVLYRPLFLVSFDPELAKASGMNARRLNLFVLILAAVTVALSMRIVGVLLIGALMVIPVMTGILLGRGFVRSHVLSVLISLVSVILGIALSYTIGTATGATIVVCALGFFIISVLVAKK